MVMNNGGLATQFEFGLFKLYVSDGFAPTKKWRMCFRRDRFTMLSRISCCCSDTVLPIQRADDSGNENDKKGESCLRMVRVKASPATPFALAQSLFSSKQQKFYPQCTP
ncbi:hypothetical protein F3Y22_tig00110584pilonHSYRG00525 [Hibiscus syriacus]|uniref:Uncharacterized protein n=1 Tax=Hibiscus syriacus TaxID=106335 RepID=A0A6A3A4N5_HIBSY|nr:hypothetical protein F3Y22_tig00110584pilonHSYRG00525 [Hibiscus syriacus]